MSSLQMIFDVLAKDLASPTFRTVAAEAKALQRTMEEADAKMSLSSKTSAAEIRTAMLGVSTSEREAAVVAKTMSAEISASMASMAEASKLAAVKTAEADAAIAKGQADLAAKTEATSVARKKSLMNIGMGAAIVTAAVIGESVKMAANFQTVTNQLVTSAGEQASSLGLVRAGLLKMSGEVGISAIDLAKGMYQVESAGFHGAAGLNVMRAAAEGAKAEGAQTETVAKALTTVLNNFGDSIQNNAVKGTDFLVAAVSLGKTRMEDFSASISNVLPVAKMAGISLAEVGGAMATMTSEGISSDQAATYLRQTIVRLADQTPKAKNEMKALGLESIDVAGHLGERGLAGTLQVLTDAIAKHLGPQGLVMLDSLKKAGQNADKFQVALSNLPPAAQTYIGALTTMVGGQKTMMGALALTGDHMHTFVDDTHKIGDAINNSGKDVKGWELVQQSLRQKLDDVKGNVTSLAIELGNKLLPPLTKVFGFLADHTGVVKALAYTIGTLLVAATVAWGVALLSTGVGEFVLAIAGLVAGLIYGYEHFKTFRVVVNDVGNALKEAFTYTVKQAEIAARQLADAWNYTVKQFVTAGHQIADLWDAVSGAVYRFFTRMRDNAVSMTQGLWHDVTGFFTRMASDIAGIFNGIVDFVHEHWRLLIVAFTGPLGLLVVIVADHWRGIVKPFEDGWHAASGFVAHLWADVTGWFSRLWKDVTGWVSRTWGDLFGATKKGTGEVTGVVGDHVVKVTGWFSRLWHDVTGWVSRLWHDVAGFFTRLAADVWNIIGPFVMTIVHGWQRIYDGTMGIVRPLWHDVTSFFGHMRDDVVGIFSWMADRIGSIWGGIRDAIAAPIRWVIENPYDQGIVPLIRSIGGILHEPSMSGLQPLHFDTGGKVPGNHQMDIVPLFGTPGEVIVPLPVVARFGGPDALMGALGFGGGGGSGGHYDIGGVIGRIGHDIVHPTDALGDLGHLVQGALGAVAGPIIHGLESTADGILGGMGGVGSDMARMVHTVGDKLLAWIDGKDKAYQAAQAAAAASYGGAPGGAGGAARWAGTVQAVLRELGLPLSATAGVLSLINSESGGNPNAINNWDSNAAAGHPSQGLMQAIPSTFYAYAGSHAGGGITDPYSNIYAGVRYAVANYGIGMLEAGGRHGAGGGYVGYAAGGMPPVGQPFWVGERGPELMQLGTPGRVHSNADSRAMARNVTMQHVEHQHIGDGVNLDLVLQQAAFRESAGQFG